MNDRAALVISILAGIGAVIAAYLYVVLDDIGAITAQVHPIEFTILYIGIIGVYIILMAFFLHIAVIAKRDRSIPRPPTPPHQRWKKIRDVLRTFVWWMWYFWLPAAMSVGILMLIQIIIPMIDESPAFIREALIVVLVAFFGCYLVGMLPMSKFWFAFVTQLSPWKRPLNGAH